MAHLRRKLSDEEARGIWWGPADSRIAGNYQEKFAVFAKITEMLYRWAGLKEEAKRIKPSSHRPEQREAEGKEDADPAES